MRRIWAMVRTEFLREFESPISLVFFLLLPLLFTAAVGAGLGGMMDQGEQEPQEVRIPIYVLQGEEGPVVAALVAALRPANLEPEIVAALPEGEFGLELPAGFTAALTAGEPVTLTLHTRPDSSQSPAVEQAVKAAQGRVGGAALVARLGVEQARQAGTVKTAEEEAAFFQAVLSETLAAAARPPATAQVRWPAGSQVTQSRTMATGAEQASAGQVVTWVQITLLGAAEVLVDERLRGTLRRMLVMPTSRGMILSGKLIARLLLGLLQMTILLAGGALLFRVNWGQDALAVALVSLAFALATVALGVLLATVVRTRGQAGSVVVGLSMAMAALGGAWYPLEVTPQLYQRVVQVLPSTWAMKAYTALLARGAHVPDVLPYVGILLGFAFLFMVLGVLRFRRYE